MRWNGPEKKEKKKKVVKMIAELRKNEFFNIRDDNQLNDAIVVLLPPSFWLSCPEEKKPKQWIQYYRALEMLIPT